MTEESKEDQSKDTRVHFNVEGAQHEQFKIWARADAGGEAKIFDSIASMFVFAAAVGYARGARRPIQGKKVDVFRWTNIDDLNQTVLRSIALAASGGDVSVLADKGDIADIVEEYATAGVDILRQELGETSRDRATEALGRLVCEMSAADE